MEKSKLLKARVYVGTYKEYNNGSLFGEWMNLADYQSKEEFLDACKDLHSDEDEPEFMYQDYSNIPDGMINESYIDPRIFGIIQCAKDMMTQRQKHSLRFLICTLWIIPISKTVKSS